MKYLNYPPRRDIDFRRPGPVSIAQPTGRVPNVRSPARERITHLSIICFLTRFAAVRRLCEPGSKRAYRAKRSVRDPLDAYAEDEVLEKYPQVSSTLRIHGTRRRKSTGRDPDQGSLLRQHVAARDQK